MSAVPPFLAGLLTSTAALAEGADIAALLAAEPAAPGLVGSVAVLDRDLPRARAGAVPLTIVLSGGAAQLDGPLGLASRIGLPLAGVRTTLRDVDDLAGNVRRVVAAVDQVRAAGLLPLGDDDEEIRVTVVLPSFGASPYAIEAALDEAAAAELPAGLPGGDARTLPALIDAALDREVPFEVVGAGTPDPVATLAAARACLDGEPDEAARLLAGDAAAALASYDAETLARTRRWCTRVDVADVGSASHLGSLV